MTAWEHLCQAYLGYHVSRDGRGTGRGRTLRVVVHMRAVAQVVASRSAERCVAGEAFQMLDGTWRRVEVIVEDSLVEVLPAGRVEKRLASPSTRSNMPASARHSVRGQRMAMGSLLIVRTVTVAGIFVTIKRPRSSADDATDRRGLSSGDRVNKILGALSDARHALVSATGASKVAGKSMRSAKPPYRTGAQARPVV